MKLTEEQKRDYKVNKLRMRWERLMLFGRPFDTKAFAECMRDTYEHFFSEDRKDYKLTEAEIDLYSRIYAYSISPKLHLESMDDFDKSQHAAKLLSFIIRSPKGDSDFISGTKLHYNFMEFDEELEIWNYEYDLMTDDMGKFRVIPDEKFHKDWDKKKDDED